MSLDQSINPECWDRSKADSNNFSITGPPPRHYLLGAPLSLSEHSPLTSAVSRGWGRFSRGMMRRDVTEAEKVDVSAVASSGNLVMLAAMRRASLWVSSLASGGFLPTSRLIVLSITGHLVICRTD